MEFGSIANASGNVDWGVRRLGVRSWTRSLRLRILAMVLREGRAMFGFSRLRYASSFLGPHFGYRCRRARMTATTSGAIACATRWGTVALLSRLGAPPSMK